MSSTRVWRVTSVSECPTVPTCPDTSSSETDSSRFDENKYYSKYVDTSTYSLDIPYSEHGLPIVRGVTVLNSSGENVSVLWSSVDNTISFSSNVDLIDHTIILF